MINLSFIVIIFVVAAFVVGVVVGLLLFGILKALDDCDEEREDDSDNKAIVWTESNMKAMYDDYSRYKDIMRDGHRKAIERTLRLGGYKLD